MSITIHTTSVNYVCLGNHPLNQPWYEHGLGLTSTHITVISYDDPGITCHTEASKALLGRQHRLEVNPFRAQTRCRIAPVVVSIYTW